ncbi:FixH family protein [Roseospirillum parvum]|uniref:Nitrogen fixation protein FixH n=1 Tax=Roseospirillum parvum TaxID=83401 RepID=A0A1G7WNR9_9PROT|nr:FixH family protein [Roseospirillum parvum]SDG73582.1 Nitrogen fixation protein FixH [Roseospirillum parvum]
MTRSSPPPSVNPARRRRPDGWWYPWIFVAGFAVVIAVNGALFYFATGTFNGLETARPWQEMNNFNQRLASFRTDRERGWTVDLATERHDATLDLALTVTDRYGQPVRGLAVEGVLWRPTRAGLDIPLRLAEAAPGRYRAVAELPAPGQWEVRAEARQGDTLLRLRERLDLR